MAKADPGLALRRSAKPSPPTSPRPAARWWRSFRRWRAASAPIGRSLPPRLPSCRTRRAVLVIAKLDRLARNARFLLSVVEGSGEAGVVFCDLPTVPAGPVGKFLVTQMAAVAELEAGLISQRTRAALAVAKARGVRLGNPSPTPATAEMAAAARQARSRQVAARASDVLAVVRQVQAEGASSLRAIAAELHAQGVLTPAGKLDWSPAQVQRLLKRENRGSIVETHGPDVSAHSGYTQVNMKDHVR